MKLHYPYKWEERKVLLKDRVLFVPDQLANYAAFQFPGWSSPEVFGNQQPVKVEYCSGNGMWIVEKALADPRSNWVAIEKKFDRISKTWLKVKKLAIPNLFMICGEGFKITSNYLPSDSVAEVFINFPDPWPKMRHWKHRIIQKPFLLELQRILSANGKFTFVTDDIDYSLAFLKEMKATGGFAPLRPDPYFVEELPGYGSSFFEELWRSKGKKIRYHEFFNLETAVQGAKVIQDPELESFSIGVEHSQKVKATSIETDCSSRDCVNLAPSIAVSRFKSIAEGNLD